MIRVRNRFLPNRRHRHGRSARLHGAGHIASSTRKAPRSFLWGWWTVYLSALTGFGLLLTALETRPRNPAGFAVLVLGMLLVVCYLVWAVFRRYARELAAASNTTRLLETVMQTSREWLWTIGPDGTFTFSGPMCQELLGYAPSELVGKHFSFIMEPVDLAQAQRERASSSGADSAWSGLVAVCRHRNGTKVVVEVSGRPVLDGQGRVCGFEGTSRALDRPALVLRETHEAQAGVRAMLASRTLLTAFQPIVALDTGDVIGAEALTRFLSSENPGASPQEWFVKAASVGLGTDLELLALQSALSAAGSLPPELYVALNLSPGACLNDRLPDVLKAGGIPMGRLVLELTEHHQVTDYAELGAALAPLRDGGLRIAVDDAGAGFASMRHIVELKPDLIKLDRQIVAGIDVDSGLRALGAAMVGFSREINAGLIAEGVETEAELAAVTSLGMNAAQGYLLGRPTVATDEWRRWSRPAVNGSPVISRSPLAP